MQAKFCQLSFVHREFICPVPLGELSGKPTSCGHLKMKSYAINSQPSCGPALKGSSHEIIRKYLRILDFPIALSVISVFRHGYPICVRFGNKYISPDNFRTIFPCLRSWKVYKRPVGMNENLIQKCGQRPNSKPLLFFPLSSSLSMQFLRTCQRELWQRKPGGKNSITTLLNVTLSTCFHWLMRSWGIIYDGPHAMVGKARKPWIDTELEMRPHYADKRVWE